MERYGVRPVLASNGRPKTAAEVRIPSRNALFLLSLVVAVPFCAISVLNHGDRASLAAEPEATPAVVAGLDGDWAKMRPITPRGYVCTRAHGPLAIDGRGDEPSWAAAAWTEDFKDIEGDARPNPRFRTRAKMLWDNDCLYVFAELEEPHIWGTITRRNEVIFQDNDFEVFIDPDGDNHNYYEFEMNVLNTVWELTLEKPYRDGGPARDPTNVEGLRSAVHVNGTLNDPTDTDRSWTVEIAIPWKGLARYAPAGACPPQDGRQWHMGFSRVEWLVDIIDRKYRKIPKEMRPEDNWVWSPQGVVDMHRPERWGFVQFSSSAATATFHPDPTLTARDLLMTVYHRQREFKKRNGRYARSVAELGMDAAGGSAGAGALELVQKGDGYTATTRVTPADGQPRVLHVRENSRLWQE